MKINYIKKGYLGMLLIVFTVTSCNKFLDVSPKDQVKDKELFATEGGFKEALSGVYATLTLDALYGHHMTFGLMGVLGYEWDFATNSYDDDKKFLYGSTTPSTSRIDGIWNNMYYAITNANHLLGVIDSKKDVFYYNNYEIIKGEALALRAFIHFDLLRVYGASFAENPDKLAIPYVKEYGAKISPQLTVRAVLENALSDLEAAQALLKKDPVYTGEPISIINDDGYLMHRQVHLNYYAVRALQARIYQYQKDYSKAYAAANDVINSGKFTWIQQANIISPDLGDFSFSPEHVFALNAVNLNKTWDNYFDPTIGGSNVYSLNYQRLFAGYYESNAADYRYLYQFLPGTGTYFLKKYKQSDNTAWPAAYKNKMPLIRLSEMYFIAAEAIKSTNISTAAGLINTVRSKRGIANATITADNIDQIAASEFRKEFIGEGQLFFYYKRLNQPIIPYCDYNPITSKGYKLPMPLSEYENASGRVDNR